MSPKEIIAMKEKLEKMKRRVQALDPGAWGGGNYQIWNDMQVEFQEGLEELGRLEKDVQEAMDYLGLAVNGEIAALEKQIKNREHVIEVLGKEWGHGWISKKKKQLILDGILDAEDEIQEFRVRIQELQDKALACKF